MQCRIKACKLPCLAPVLRSIIFAACLSLISSEDQEIGGESLTFPPFREAIGNRTIAWGWWSKDDREWFTTFEKLYERHLPVRGSVPKILGKAETSAKSTQIKKILHQVWLGNTPMPKQFQEWRQTCIDMHPSWTHVLWTESEASELPMLDKNAYENAANIGAKSDALRLEALYRFGGVYLDTDFECLRPLDELLLHVDFAASLSNVGAVEISNGVIAARRRHPIVRGAILTPPAALPPPGNAKNLAWVGMSTIMSSGPGRFTRVVMSQLQAADAAAAAAVAAAAAAAEGDPGAAAAGEAAAAAAAAAAEVGRVVVLPSNFFFPVPNSIVSLGEAERRRLRAQPVPAETLALHHWAGSWLKHEMGVPLWPPLPPRGGGFEEEDDSDDSDYEL